jgi:CBS domain-containing protein
MLGLVCVALNVLRLPRGPRMAGSRAAASSQPRLVGFFSSTDQNELWPASNDLVSDHMVRRVVYLELDQDLKTAGHILNKAGITGAPVLQDGKVVGILSQTDLLYKVAGRASLRLPGDGAASTRYAENTARLQKIEANSVAAAMSRDPACIREDATMQEAAARMLKSRHNRLCVINPVGRLVGIITSSDVVRLALRGDQPGAPAQQASQGDAAAQ